jgi:hypothetical protein
MRTVAALAALGCVAALAAGCAAGGSSGGPASSASPSVSVPPTPSAGASVPPGIPVPSRPGKVSPKPPIGEAPPITVTGVVQEGAEPGCRVLGSGSEAWLLVGGDPQLIRPGARVRIVGVRGTDATTCQQGRPLIVQQAWVL